MHMRIYYKVPFRNRFRIRGQDEPFGIMQLKQKHTIRNNLYYINVDEESCLVNNKYRTMSILVENNHMEIAFHLVAKIILLVVFDTRLGNSLN